MTIHRAVRRLNIDLKHLHQAEAEKRQDVAARKRAVSSLDQFEPADPNRAVRAQQIRDRFDPMIAGDKKKIAHDRKVALRHLRPAELHMSLKQTNRDRRDLGLSKLDRPVISTKSVAGCARALLLSKNVSFWSGLSSGSEKKTLQALADGKRAFVPATGRHVMPKLKMMQSLVAMSQRGHIMINALTGGQHSSNSNHYRGTAVDLDVGTGNSGMIERMARRYGGARNFERDHIHLDF